ncbi:zinc-ribbon domain-containing protein [Flavobacterium sp. RSB2_4_14]|uniref:zinc-ribbon domain-containing protein n=1 Tax=Flavobacterium sp. RSB2_4_14 TaxID=3447665 RepID=UPI003F2A840D
MIIIFGTKARCIRNGQIDHVDCPNCGKVTRMSYSIYGKYFHLFHIPFVPIKKIKIAECNNCNKTFDYIDLYESIRIKIHKEKEKRPLRYPFTMYSGIIILICFFAYGFYDSKMTESDTLKFIKKPQVGDMYYVKISDGQFSTFRIDSITRTELYVTNNDFQIDLDYDIDTIDENKNYTNSKDTLSILDLQEFLNNETIIKVIRK